MPGGLIEALERAYKNRQRPLISIAWRWEGKEIRPGDWLNIKTATGLGGWWLVFCTSLEEMIVVERGGGYLKLKRHGPFRINAVAEEPPWWETWTAALLNSL